MFACTRRLGYAGLGKSAIKIRSAGGVERGFVVIVCRACPDPPCAKVCPVDAITLR
ncbi:MAG: [Fe-S]-binding protein, partial [Thermoprotei archaeon]